MCGRSEQQLQVCVSLSLATHAIHSYLIALRAVRQAEFGIAVYYVAEVPKRRTCVILGPAFLHRVSYSGIGTHLHEGESVLF